MSSVLEIDEDVEFETNQDDTKDHNHSSDEDVEEEILLPRGVINETLIRRSVVTELEEKFDVAAPGLVPREADINLQEVTELCLSFSNIYQIDNLRGFERIVKLQLDNNIIEKIDHLSHLVNLKWLDLSFNNITKIENLERLTQLEDLSLCNNNIEKIENLECLVNLNVLSLGNNKVSDLEYLKELRQFKNLQLLNLKGNPCASNDDYFNVVFAYLTTLKYLDYQLIEPQRFHLARDAKLDEIYALEEQEKALNERLKLEAAERAQESKLEEANLAGMANLFDTMIQDDKEYANIKMLPDYGRILAEFRKVFEAEVAGFTDRILESHRRKQAEQKLFRNVLNKLNQETEQQGIDLIQTFEARKKRAFRTHEAQFEGDMQAEEGQENNDALDQLRSEVGMVTNDLMDMEMVLVEQNTRIIQDFTEEFSALVDFNTREIDTFFRTLMETEDAYAKNVTELTQKLLTQKSDDNSLDDEDADVFLKDREQVLQSVSNSHDNHLATLNLKVDDISGQETALSQALLKEIQKHEYDRNRHRIVEIDELATRYLNEIDTLKSKYQEDVESFEDFY